MTTGAGRTLAIVGLGVMTGGLGTMLFPAFAATAFGVGYMAGSFLGQMIFPAGRGPTMPRVGDYPIQRAEKGIPVPIEYGKCRMAGNVVWMGELHEYHVSQGGKGGGGSASEQKMYRKSFLISICEGERTVTRMWKGKHEVDMGEVMTAGKHRFGGGIMYTHGKGADGLPLSRVTQEMTLFTGDGENAGLETLIGEDYSSYKYDCCVFFANYDLGASDTIPQFTFEVSEIGETMTSGAMSLLIAGDAVYTSIKWIDKDTGAITKSEEGWPLFPVPPRGWTTIAVMAQCGQHGIVCWMDDNDDHYYIAAYDTDDGTRLWTWEIPLQTENPVANYDPVSGKVCIAFPYPNSAVTLQGTSTEVNVAILDPETGNVVWYALVESLCIGPPAFANNMYAYLDLSGRLILSTKWYCMHQINGVVLSADSTYCAITPDLTGSMGTTWTWLWGVLDPWDTETEFVTVSIFSTSSTLVIRYWDSPTRWDFHQRWINAATGATVADVAYVNEFWGFTEYYEYGAILSTGSLVVFTRNTGLNTVYVTRIDSDGTMTNLFTYGTAHPLGLAVDESDNIYVCGDDTDAWTGSEGETASMFKLSSDGTVLWHIYDSLTFEDFIGIFTYTVTITGGNDANPSDIIDDLLTNTRYGVAMPENRLDSDSFVAIQTYCTDNDLLISLVISDAKPVLDWIQYICSHFGGFMYWMGGKLYLGAWKDDAAEVDIGRDDLVADEGPPLQVTKRRYSERNNHIELAWENREDVYGPAVAKATDDVDICRSGQRKKMQVDLAGVKRAALASKLAWRYLIDGMYRFESYSFRLGPKGSLLHVGQVVNLSDGFKVVNKRVRITSINESKDGVNLDVEAMEDVADHYPDLLADGVTATAAEVTQREPEASFSSTDLADAVVTTREDWTNPLLYISLSPGNAYCSGWHLFLSRDGDTYSYLTSAYVNGLTAGDANAAGTLLTALPAARAPTWRGDESFQVDIGTVTDLRTDITDAQFFNNLRLAKIDDEIVAYKTCAEQVTPGQWKVTSLIRGLFQTEPVAHAIGAIFRTLDTSYTWNFRETDIGRTIYLKVLTAYGDASQDLAEVDPVAVTIQGCCRRPYSASVVRTTPAEIDGGFDDYAGDTFTVYWNLCNKTAGFNVGGQDGGATWAYGDDTSELVPHAGGAFGSYQADPQIQGVDLVFKDASGTIIGTKSLGVVSQATISKATDLGGNNPAEVEVWPRYSLRATLEESVTVDDNT